MNLVVSLLFLLTIAVISDVSNAERCTQSMKNVNTKLFCYYSKLRDVNSCRCTHIVLPANSDVKSIENLRARLNGVKILVTVHEFNEGLVDLLKQTKVDGLEVDLKKLDSKNDISDFISTARSKLGSDLYTVVSIPPRTELLAKYYDFKGLAKHVDAYILQTAFLGASTNVTFHPSRLSGLWDMQNADSVVDLVTGLGAPISKLVIAAPVQAFQFKLQDEKHTAPGSPALEVKSITREDLCRKMTSANWTLERDQDQAGPYIFRKNQWIAFDDPMSMDIKAKYARVRGLAGLALKDLSQDGGKDCGGLLLEAAYNGLSKQSRAPRGAVLQSLEREILTPVQHHNNIQVSPYRITRIIDTEGKIHAVRQDTRTEFECSRQGYFVHPRSCNRFYRCVKFNQLSDEYNVFEFDCPAGLAFDSRVEVCVWPGSLPDGAACSGSSEIAPVPKERFVCPHEPGYYADPENCRWFFACLDHGQEAMTAYEFRCPFGLVFDQDRLLCEWPWLVPKCVSGYATSGVLVEFHGGAYGTHGGVVGVNGVVDAHGSLGVGGLGGGHGLVGLHAGAPQGGVVLENYNGLGVLQPVTLGGLHGPISEPIAKVYSSFGHGGGGAGGVGIVGHGSGVHGTGIVGNALGVGGDYQDGANIGHALVGVNVHDGEQNIGIQHAGEGILLGEGTAGHGLAGAGVGQGSILGGIGGGIAHGLDHGAVLTGAGYGVNAGENLVGVDIQGGHQDGVLLTQGVGQLDTSRRGSIKYQGGLSNADLSGGKSTVTYHGNLASSGNLGSVYSGGSQYGGSLGVDGLRGRHRGSVRYQEANAGLDDHLGGGQSTGTYHGTFGGSTHAGDQVLVDGASSKGGILTTDAGHYNAAQDGVVLVQDGGVGQVGVGLAGVDHFGQRGKILTGDVGRKSTVSYHGNFGKSRQNLFDQGSYTINSPIDQASLVFGTKLGGSKLGDGAIIEGQNFASNYVHAGHDRIDDSGLKLSDQVLVAGQGVVGHDLGGVGVTTVHGGDRGVLLTGAEDAGKIGVGAVGLHAVGVGLDSGNIGLQQSTVTLHGNQGSSQGGVIVDGGILHGPTEPSVGQIDIAVGKGDSLNINRGSLRYDAGEDHTLTGDHLNGAILLNQGQGDATSSSYQNFNSKQKSGRINIVGGGFSAVGVYPNTYKQSTAAIQTVTSSPISPISVTPISVTASPIPVVTSVPIPSTHTNDNLDIYNGNGVVANVPELQVKVETPSAAVIPNVQRTHIASTGAALEVENGGYVYDKPAVAFVGHGASRVVEDSGAKSFIHQRIEHQQPLAIGVTPTVAVQPISSGIPQKPVISSYHVQQAGTNQYIKPSIDIQPQINIYQTPLGISTVGDHSGGSYGYQNIAKSTVAESVTPSVLFEQKVSGPVPTVSSVHFGSPVGISTIGDHSGGSYSYQNIAKSTAAESVTPSILFEQKVSRPVPTVSSVHFGSPVGISTIGSHSGGSYSYQNLAKSTVAESVTPSVLFEQKVSGPAPTVSSVHFGSPIGISTIADHSGRSYNYNQNLAKSTVVQSVTPSVLLEEKISGPAPTVSSVHFGTALVDDHQPSVVVQPVFKQRVGSIGVSTFRPVSFANVEHKNALVESVTPSVLVQPVVQTATPVVVENITPAVPVIRQKIRPIKPAISSVHFGTTLVENVTPSVVVQSHGEPIGAVEVSTVAPVSYPTVQHINTGTVEHVTPSIVTQPILHANLQPVDVGVGKIQPQVSYSSINFGTGTTVGVQPNHEIQGVEISKHVTADVIENVTPSVVLQQKVVPQGGGSYFYQRNDFTKSGNLHGITSSLPSASFSFQSQPARGFEKQLNVESVTPSSILVQQEIKEPLSVIPGQIGISDQSGFLSSISKSRGFSKFGQVESVTPAVVLQGVPHVQGDAGAGVGHGGYSFESTKSRGFAKFGQVIPSVTPATVLDVQPIQHTVITEGDGNANIGSFSYQNTGHRGSVKYSTPQIVQTVTSQPILQHQTVGTVLSGNGQEQGDNLFGTFAYEGFGVKTQIPSVAFDNTPKSLYKGSAYYEGHQENTGYRYPKPTVAFNEGPVLSQDYDGLEPVKEEPFVAKKAYVTGNVQKSHVVYEENYPSVSVAPIIPSSPVFVTSTLKPTYQSTAQSIYNTIPSTTIQPVKFFYHDSRLSSTPRPFEIKSNIIPSVAVTTPRIVISSTPRPIVPAAVDYNSEIRSPIAPIGVTQSKPIFKYSFSSLDSQYSSTPAPIDLSSIEVTRRPLLNRVRVTTPAISTYEPVIIKSTTVQPILDVATPIRAYLPAAGIVENYQAPILKSRRVLKVVQPTSKAIVKVNDFHPLLSAKLGAQCTCIADSVRLRNKPVKVSIDDGEHIEEFVVKPDDSPDLLDGVVSGESYKDAYIGGAGLIGGDNAIVVPDYESQKVVAITPVPEITIGSTIAAPISRTPLVVRKRVRVRPVSTTPAFIEAPVTRITDIFLKSTPLPDDYQLNAANLAINSDLNIVKPGPVEALSAHNFDRYGPGGLRSKTETLQGTIDCQRAGLFRHPTQCNKFYSCRWDCTKNKFTLHIFNCPVHLTFDDSLGACNWPSQGPACLGNTLLPSD
ncbi:hypothetical protein Trydic_g348 [Trypoxylus dichotomus]